MSEYKTVSDAPGGDVPAPSAPEVGNPPSNKGMRIFIIGCVLSLVINCILAFGFFLRVEDNPRVLLSVDLFYLLAPSLVVEAILIGLALYVRRGWWRIPAGFALVTLVILALTANWALTNHPIPNQEEMCTALNEVYAVLEEGKTIDASTPAEQARAWRSKLVTVWQKNFKTIQFVINLNTSKNIDLMLKEYQALEGREKTGTVSIDIRSKVNDFENELQPHIALVCSGQ
jgi:hypothetical protein